MSTVPQTYYVYILVRSTTGKPFYVGKGHGNRVYDHESEARRGHRCQKCNTIRKIWRQGGQVQRYIVFTTEIEAEALAYEVETIALYGRANLCNRTDGGDGASGSWSDDRRAAVSKRNKQTHNTPEVRAHLSAATKAYYANNPDARAASSARQKARLSDPALRAKISTDAKAQWADPEIRAKRNAASITPREHAAHASQVRWSKPDARAKHSATLKAAFNTPEMRAQLSAKARAALTPPEVRAKISANTRTALSSPEARKKLSEAVKAAWVRRKAAKANKQ